jgi:hypothetical protein
MKNPRSALALALGSASIAVACSAGPDLTPPPSPTAHTSAALSGSATACAPSVTVSASSCSVTVGATTCDCSDCACLTSAFESCLGDAGISPLPLPLPLPDAAGIPVSLPPLPFDDGGLPSFGWGDDGGSTSAACSASAVAAAKTAFCNAVDAWLTANGSSATLDCSQVGSLSFPVTAPTTLPTAPASLVCSAATHAAFATAQSTLAGCDPLDYVGWDTSAQLQLFEDGACEP